jgi:hypothetical protein
MGSLILGGKLVQGYECRGGGRVLASGMGSVVKREEFQDRRYHLRTIYACQPE